MIILAIFSHINGKRVILRYEMSGKSYKSSDKKSEIVSLVPAREKIRELMKITSWGNQEAIYSLLNVDGIFLHFISKEL